MFPDFPLFKPNLTPKVSLFFFLYHLISYTWLYSLYILSSDTPPQSSKEVLQLGSFGGTYFRKIKSNVTCLTYSGKEVIDDIPSDWLCGLNINTQICSSNYDVNINNYKVKCGASLDEWEGSGWIKSIDPYGWFQWYCRYICPPRLSTVSPFFITTTQQVPLVHALSCSSSYSLPLSALSQPLFSECAKFHG